MVYWKHIPEDFEYRSKFKASSSDARFLTFDTDVSGFNNQRMVFEINLVTAIVTGRILVLPHDRPVNHILGDSKKKNKKNKNSNNGRFAMDDFFDL